MLRPPTHQPVPPFAAPVARRLRDALGLTLDQVAYDLRSAYGLPHVTPGLVDAWERGITAPGLHELTALARVLWCPTGELVDAPRTVREYRGARCLTAEEVAHGIGVDPLEYLRLEQADVWRGTEPQTAALAGVLDLSLPDLVRVTGRTEMLAELLRDAVTGRPRAYVRPLGRLLPLDRGLLTAVLRRLHRQYKESRRRSTRAPAAGRLDPAVPLEHDGPASGDPARAFLEGIVDAFWSGVRRCSY
ncbi:helix-turn-helix domain-containing protein [Streptomyces minutiscleroticus]|uniref:helix-turn-helix domain-containing protein n=1 Tax=Streptomyces minutiscleroticus TaxID=68238 RepID=UPI001E57D5FC|nr:helix-turn-helix transcriptional regulator [Streptomyces minutiscleroticus]